MLYTNYTNYLTELAVTKVMQILIIVYYVVIKLFIQANPLRNSTKSASGYVFVSCFFQTQNFASTLF